MEDWEWTLFCQQGAEKQQDGRYLDWTNLKSFIPYAHIYKHMCVTWHRDENMLQHMRRKHMLDVRKAAEGFPLWQQRPMCWAVYCCLADSPHTHPWEGRTCCRDGKKVGKVCLCGERSDAASSLYLWHNNTSPGFNIQTSQRHRHIKTKTHKQTTCTHYRCGRHALHMWH